MSHYYEKRLNFISSNKKSPFLLIPLFVYVVFKRSINMQEKGAFDKLEFCSGMSYGNSILNLGNVNKIAILKKALAELEALGFGQTRSTCGIGQESS